MTDLTLVHNIQNGVDTDNSLRQLTVAHSGIVLQQIHRFHFPSGCSLVKSDLIAEKEAFIYEAALTYKPDRGCKVSTWIGQNTRYTLLDKFKKVKLEMEEAAIEVPVGELEPEENDFEFKGAMVEEVFEFLKNETDETTYRIFELRYLKPTNGRLEGWHAIGRKLGISHEWSRQIYLKGLAKIKEHFHAA